MLILFGKTVNIIIITKIIVVIIIKMELLIFSCIFYHAIIITMPNIFLSNIFGIFKLKQTYIIIEEKRTVT